jgi:hypothetical protein
MEAVWALQPQVVCALGLGHATAEARRLRGHEGRQERHSLSLIPSLWSLRASWP